MAAKLRTPPVQPWIVARPRLLETISQGVDGPLTLVSAPAGSGKTVLASCWAASKGTPGPVAWVSLDAEDGQPGVFWSYVIAALAASGLPVSEVGLPVQPDTVEHSLLVRLAACLSDRPQPIVLILDNAQFLVAREICDEIDFLIQHASPQLRVVVLTRVDPPLPLHRYRVSGSMTEIRLGRLSFTPAEVRAMLASHGVDMPDDAASALADRTRGWAAGLRLALLAQLAPVDAPWLPHRGDDQGPLADYFGIEVLDAQPPQVRDFLLRTSLVDRLWPSLAVELTGRRDADRALTDLARTGGFLVASPRVPGSYEYQPMVRDLLRARLHAEAPTAVDSLHRTAASWLADHSRPTDAIPHAAAAGEWDQAAALVIRNLEVGQLIAPGGRLVEPFAGMPADVAGPEAAAVHAAVALARCDPEDCAKHLLRARELVGDGPPDRAWTLHVTIAVTEAVCAGSRGDVDGALIAVSAAEVLLGHASKHDVDVSDLRSLVLSTRSGVLLLAGRFEEAVAGASAALRASDRPGCERVRLLCLGQLALAEALRGRLGRAVERAREASSIADRCGLAEDRPPAAEVAFAWVRAEQYDIGSATAHADRALLSAGIRHDPVAACMLAQVRARLYRARGDLTGAVAEINRARAAIPGTLPAWLVDMLALHEAGLRSPGRHNQDALRSLSTDGGPMSARRTVLLAWAEVAAGETAAANEMVSAFRQRPDLPVDLQVEVWLLTAMGHLAHGRGDLARDALDRGLVLAAPERLRRPILEAPPRLRSFLRHDRSLARRHPWLIDTGAPHTRVPAPVAARSPQPIIEPLTDKEGEVLHYLAAHLSTEEIARSMYVSVNTVKTHVRGVLRKLAVSRRNEAVRRGHDLGLV
jgi:LuxR family maltose regulon positive regulatory protein